MIKYIFIIILILLFILINYFKNKISKDFLFISKTIIIVLFIETTIFNINSYRTDFGKLDFIKYDSQKIYENKDENVEGSQYFTFKNLDKKIKSIYINFDELEENQVIDYDIFYSDKSTINRYLASKSYCDDVDKTKFSSIYLSR